MDVKDFYYELPQELIAQDPLEDRSSSRLLVLDKNTGGPLQFKAAGAGKRGWLHTA